jgi:hypothetical protein
MRENGAVVYMLKGRDPLHPAELANVTSRCFLGVQVVGRTDSSKHAEAIAELF